jgi:hypothetical protein
MSVTPDPALAQITGLINGFWPPPVIGAAVVLGLPDLLGDGARTADDLAAAAGAHAGSVFRLLRAMQTLGLVTAGAGGAFRLTEAGRFLRSDVEGSVRGRALMVGDMLWKQFGDLAMVVRTGGRTTAIPTGPEGFAALAGNPERLAAFQTAMAESSRRVARAAVEAYDFGRFRAVLDLGGGYGGVLAVLLQCHPGMTGAVCDLAYLEAGATAFLGGAGVAARGRFLAGDFFESVPAGYDAYVLKFIVHDWGDAEAGAILSNCRAAAADSARLVLVEQVVPEIAEVGAADQTVMCADLTMMTMGGKERTAAEYRELLQAAGWRLSGITPVGAGFSVLEAVPG